MIGVRFPAEAGNFSLHHRVQIGPESHSASYKIGKGALSLRVKRPVRETDHSVHLVPSLKMRGAILPLPNTSL